MTFLIPLPTASRGRSATSPREDTCSRTRRGKSPSSSRFWNRKRPESREGPRGSRQPDAVVLTCKSENPTVGRWSPLPSTAALRRRRSSVRRRSRRPSETTRGALSRSGGLSSRAGTCRWRCPRSSRVCLRLQQNGTHSRNRSPVRERFGTKLTGAGDGLSVGAERHAVDRPPVARKKPHLLARRHAPKPDGLVRAPRRQVIAVGVKTYSLKESTSNVFDSTVIFF